MSDSGTLVDSLKERLDEKGHRRKRALVTGSVAIGAVVTGSLFRKLTHVELCPSSQLRKAVDADVNEIELMEGRARFYQRTGTGVPIVLLHGFGLASSTYEIKPVFERFAAFTERPLFALDWFGFGRSERPPVRYTPSLYQRQLRRFLSEHVHQPADVIAFSTACEYTARTARSLPYLFNRLALVTPSGLSDRETVVPVRRLGVTAAGSIGAFEIFFHRLTRRQLLRREYERQVLSPGSITDDLVDYAIETTHVQGAHNAARYALRGLLSEPAEARLAYSQLRLPTLMIVPSSDLGLTQHFDDAERVTSRNPQHLHLERISSGLLPQWEVPHQLFAALEPLFDDSAAPS